MRTLHQMQMSGNCYKIRLASRQLGIPLALKDYGLHDGETRKAPFLAKNPNGRVPLLELDDGRCLPESNAILWYLAEGSALIPKDPWQRAQMLNWMFFEQYSHEPYIAVTRFLLTEATPEMLEKRRASIPDLQARGRAALGVMDTHLAKQEWFSGERYGLADISLYGYTHAADEGGYDLNHYPAVCAWLERVRGQPGHIPLSEHW
jgi:glutathione S-transferase